MNIDNGSMNFTASIDTKQLVEAVKDIEKRLGNLEGTVTQAGESLDKLGSGFKNVLAAIGGTAAITGFVKKMFDVRSSFQDTQSAMEVFLGSAEKAEEHMKALQQYAWYNMFDFSTLTQASAQLQAFGTNVDDVIPLIDRLSNIAAGTKTSLMDLVETFNRAKSVGTADSRMLMSFATKGLDVVTTLREMGVAVDGTSVSFEQLMMAVEAATNEGGRFYNLMDAQFNNLSSLAGAVEDDISIMLNELGERLQPTMENVLRFTHKLIDNYETVGRVLVGLIATYGTYRAALVAVTTAQKLQAKYTAANTAATKTHYAWTLMMQKAQALLNKTMLLNPYVAIATALVAATAAIVAFTKHKQKEHQAIIDSTKDMREEFTQTNMLIDKLKDANKSEEERRKILEELREVNPGIVDGIKNEADAYAELSERVKDYNRQQLAAMAVKQFTVKEDFQGAVDDMDAAMEKLNSANADMVGAWGEIYFNYNKLITEGENIPIKMKNLMDSLIESQEPDYKKAQKVFEAYDEFNSRLHKAQELDKGENDGRSRWVLDKLLKGLSDNDFNKASTKLDDLTSEYEKKAQALKDKITSIADAVFIDDAKAKQDFISTQMKLFFPEEKEVRAAGAAVSSTLQSVYADIMDDDGKVVEYSLVNKIEKAKADLDKLRADIEAAGGRYNNATAQKNINAAEETLKNLKASFQSITGLEYDRIYENNLKAQREANAAQIELIDDAFKQKRRKTEAQFDNEIEDLKRRLNIEANLTKEQRSAINNEIYALEKQKAKALEAIDNEEIANRRQLQASLDELKAEEARRAQQWEYEKQQIAIDAKEDGFQKELAQMELNHEMRMDEIKREAAEEEKVYYETAKERFKKENPNADPNVFDATWSGIPEEDKAAIGQRAQERTDAENNAYFNKKQKLISELLTQYEDYEAKKLKIAEKYRDEQLALESQINEAKTKAEKESLQNALEGSKKGHAKETLEVEVERINAGYGKVKDKINAINNAYDAYITKLREAGANEDEITAAKREQAALVAGMRKYNMSDWLGAGSQVAGVISSIGAAAGNDALRDFGDALSFAGDIGARIADGDYLGAALAVITEIGSQIADAIAKTNALRLAMEDAGETVRQQRIDALLDGGSSIFGDDAISGIKNYMEAMRMAKEAQSDFASMVGEQVKVVDYGWLANLAGKDDVSKSLAEFAAETGAGLYDTYGNLNADTLRLFLDTYDDIDDATRQWMENAIEYSGQYQEAMEGVASYLSDLFGNVAGDIADKMIEAFIESGDAAVDLGETVADVGRKMAKDLLKNMILTKYFDGLEEDFKNKIAKDGMSADTAGYIMSTIQSAMTALDGDMEYWNQVIQGLSSMWGDAAGDAESVGAGTALASASQESIDLMNGQLNAMRNVQASIDSKIGSILISLSGIDTHIQDGFERSNRHLERIADNTSDNGSIVRALGLYNN